MNAPNTELRTDAVTRLSACPGRILKLDVRTWVAMAMAQGVHLDADETAIFARQLESIRATAYDVQYPELIWDKLVPMGGQDVDPGAEFFTWSLMDTAGRAKLVTNYGDDFPLAEVQAGQFTTPLASYGIAYQYSIQDLRRGAMANLPIDQKRAIGARNLMARELDSTIALGDAAAGLTGMINNALVTILSPITGNWIAGGATPLQILNDLLKIERDIITVSKGIERPDTMALPVSLYSYIASTPMSSLVPDITILDFFLKRSMGIRDVQSSFRLETAGASGATRIVAFKKDVTKVEGVTPVLFEQFAPQVKSMAFRVNCHMRTGGVVIRFPGSVRYMDGC